MMTMESTRERLISFTIFVAALSATTSTVAQTFSGLGLKLQGMDNRDNSGHTFNTGSYNNVYLRFAPINNNKKSIDFSGKFQISGNELPQGYTDHCQMQQQFLIYDSIGPRHQSYICPEPAQICLGKTCIKNTKKPSAIVVDTRVTQSGGAWKFSGKASIKFDDLDTHDEIVITETIDLAVAKGSCQLHSYLSQTSKTESYLKPSPFDPKLGPQPSVITERSTAGAACALYVE